jgi:hypothetical protein
MHSPLEGARRCQYDGNAEFARDQSILHDGHLADYAGSDGLMRLLSLIAEAEVPATEVLEMIKRIHIPGYEHARGHFSAAINGGAFEPNTLPGYYTQANIEAALRYIKVARE